MFQSVAVTRYTSAPTLRADGVGRYIVSKQDTHFVNTFSMVIGLLALMPLLIVLARVVAAHTQETDTSNSGTSRKAWPRASSRCRRKRCRTGQHRPRHQARSALWLRRGAADPKDGSAGVRTGLFRLPRAGHRRGAQGRGCRSLGTAHRQGQGRACTTTPCTASPARLARCRPRATGWTSPMPSSRRASTT